MRPQLREKSGIRVGTSPMISVSHLVKRYGAHVAVNDVSFEVGPGEVVGFLGPNGAGKSTTMRILAGSLGMTSGEVKIDGHDVATESLRARRRIGYMPEAVPLYPEMRVSEYLTFRAELKGVARSARRGSVGRAMEKANVRDVAETVIGHLSKGYRQRVGLADALVASPPILILDEPTAGLDPNQIRQVRALVKELAKEHAVLLSTHILSEVEASCTRVLLIARGRLVAQGPTQDIQRMRRPSAVDLAIRGDAATAERALRAVQGVANVTRPGLDGAALLGDVSVLRCTWGKKLAHGDVAAATETAVAALVHAGIAIREVRQVGGSLEDVFAELTLDAAEATRGRDEAAT